MTNRVIILLLILLIPTCLFADDLDEILRYLSDKVLSVHITARLLDKDQVIVWDAESSHITNVGKAVNIRLVGSGVVIDSYITPFGNLDETLVLVANGEMWFADGNQEGIRYESFIKSVPVRAGEKVIFFPLGVAVDSQTNIYTIQLEIQILPYAEVLRMAE